jgi:hypothetical protein
MYAARMRRTAGDTITVRRTPALPRVQWHASLPAGAAHCRSPSATQPHRSLPRLADVQTPPPHTLGSVRHALRALHRQQLRPRRRRGAEASVGGVVGVRARARRAAASANPCARAAPGNGAGGGDRERGGGGRGGGAAAEQLQTQRQRVSEAGVWASSAPQAERPRASYVLSARGERTSDVVMSAWPRRGCGSG